MYTPLIVLIFILLILFIVQYKQNGIVSVIGSCLGGLIGLLIVYGVFKIFG